MKKSDGEAGNAGTDEVKFVDTLDGAQKHLKFWTATVEELIQQGATGKKPTDAQKWEIGDAVNALTRLAGSAAGRARRGPAPVTVLPPEYAEKFNRLRSRLVDAQPAARSVLVDYARVAAAIAPGDPLRDSALGFFFARALAGVEDAQERRGWAEIAQQNQYSVARLREELNAGRAKNAKNQTPKNQTAKEPTSKEPAPKNQTPEGRRGVYRCAQTGKLITDTDAMVEVHVNRRLTAAPTPSSESRRSPKSGLSLGSGLSRARERRTILRFASLSACAAWASAHQFDDVSHPSDDDAPHPLDDAPQA